MAGFKMEVSNPNGFTEMIQKMQTAFSESTLRKAGATAATVVKDEAIIRAPKGPGPTNKDLLRGKKNAGIHHQGKELFWKGYGAENIIVAFRQDRSVEGELATYMTTFTKEAYYLRFYEYGTSHHAAQPFFRPAIDGTRELVQTTISAVIQQAIKEAGL